MEATLKEVSGKFIDSCATDLYNLNSEIWKNPELNFKEHNAHSVLTDFLETRGFQVSRKTPLETAFVARFGSSDGPKVGICCEYDALPGIGHGCGHNLIAEAGVAAALGVKAALMSQPELKGEVIVLGTPAEEGGGGKVKMISLGSFDECDVCMMVHPAPCNILAPTVLAITRMNIVFHGKASHAAAAPWEGINALDAAVACYTSVSMMRQQMKPSCRVHGIIVDGGEKPNIIPRRSELNYYVRGLTDEDVSQLKAKLEKCAKAAAEATGMLALTTVAIISCLGLISLLFEGGCCVEIRETDEVLQSLLTNSILANLFASNAETVGVSFMNPVNEDLSLGSTDMGNVSKVKPSIQPEYKISTVGMYHTEAFAEAANKRENQAPTLAVAKAMAYTTIDLLCRPELVKAAKEEFSKKTCKHSE